MKPLIALAAILLTFCVVILAVWGHDVWSDRRRTLVVLTDTPIFVGNGDGCAGTQMTTARPNTVFRVKRIRYWKDCATIDVESSGGRRGHIVLGDGDVSVTPPLP
jgi:hypothetical protein